MVLVPNPELGGDSDFRHKKGPKQVLAIEFHVNSTELHRQRVMLYIGQKEIHMHEKGSGVYIHQVDNTTRATKGMHQGT